MEDSAVVKIRIAFDKYKLNAEKQINTLNKENNDLRIHLAFLLFEYQLIHRTLSSDIKDIFNKNNQDNRRIIEITSLRFKWLNGEITEKTLPLEIKLVIKELKELGNNE